MEFQVGGMHVSLGASGVLVKLVFFWGMACVVVS